MQNDSIDDEEILYRAVPNLSDYWKESAGVFTSAIFSDSKGVSVDRDGGRSEAEIIEAFNKRYSAESGLVAITGRQCREAGAHPIPKPTTDNPYHAEIHQSAERVQLSGSRKKALRDHCRIIRLPAIARNK